VTADISLQAHQREAAEVAQKRSEEPPWNTMASRLLSAGWEHKVRSGRRILVHPQTGYWYGESCAYDIVERSS